MKRRRSACRQAALRYAARGWSVVPVEPAGKRPIVPWLDLQQRPWRRAYGPLPVTVEALTGGGGRHLYFRHPGLTTANRVGLAAGVDLRGDGGCVVAPPSLHASGRHYAWADERSPDETGLAPLPEWLRHLTHPGKAHPGHPLAHWRELAGKGVEEGARNSTLASLAGHLLWHGVDPQVVLELLLAWNHVRCRPPLPDQEVAGVVSSITKLHESD